MAEPDIDFTDPQVQERLQKVIESCGTHLSEVQAELKTCQQANRVLEDSCTEERKAADVQDTEVKTLRQTNDRQAARLKTLKVQLDECLEVNTKLLSENEILHKQTASLPFLEAQGNNAKLAAADANARLTRIQTEVDLLNTQKRDLELSLSKFQNVEASRKTVESLRRERDKVQKEIEDSKITLESVKTNASRRQFFAGLRSQAAEAECKQAAAERDQLARRLVDVSKAFAILQSAANTEISELQLLDEILFGNGP